MMIDDDADIVSELFTGESTRTGQAFVTFHINLNYGND